MNEKESSIYMAGFFDGEGYVGLLKRKRSETYTEYIIQASVGQNDGAIMDWVKENFGGHLHLVKRDRSYYWIISNKAALLFLKRIVPYLKYKKSQAELAIEFFEKRPKTQHLLKEEYDRREELYVKLKAEKRIFAKSKYCIVREQRLNESTPKGDVIVWTLQECSEENPKE